MKDDFIKKLRNINKMYNEDLEEEILLESLNYEKIENIRESENELVIGYFDKNITNFQYYITPEYMETLIDEQRLIETELNKPINNLKIQINNLESINVISQFLNTEGNVEVEFELVENDKKYLLKLKNKRFVDKNVLNSIKNQGILTSIF